MNFDLVLTAQFAELFRQLNKLNENLKLVQVISRAASEQIQNDFKKSANGTAQFSDSSNKLLSVLSSLTSAIGNLDIGGTLQNDREQFSGLAADIKLTSDQVKFLADAVLQEADLFTDASDEKQLALQKEVEALKALQVEAAKNPDKAKEFTSEIQTQVFKVRELTEEIKKSTIAPQRNPFGESTEGIQKLRNQLLRARDDAESARKKFGEFSPEFKKANQDVKVLEQTMRSLMESSTAGSEDEITRKTVATGEFNQAIIESITNINKQADAVITEASQFNDFTDEKQFKLQEEIKLLRELQTQLSTPQGVEQVKQTTVEIEKQTAVVKNLTDEIKKIVVPDQTDPFAKSTTGVISLRTQILNARNAAALAGEKYGEWSPQFAAATQRLALLQNRLDQINKTAQAFNPEARLQGITNVVRGSLGGFNAVVAAMGLFGEETEDAQKALLKVQQLMLFTQGINEVLQLGTGFKALALQLGLTQASFTGASEAQEAFSTATAADSATITSGTKDLLKLTTNSETLKQVIDKTKVSKVADAAASELNAVSQTKAATAAGANAASQTSVATAYARARVAMAQAAIAAEANAVAQTQTAVTTGAAGGAANVAGAAFTRLWAIMVANPVIAVAAGVLAVAAAILYFSEQTDDAAENQIKLNEAEKESLKFLQQLNELNNKVARDRLERSEADLKIAQAQGQAPQAILQKEIELERERRLISLNSIETFGLTKTKLGELTAEYESSIQSLKTLKAELRADPDNDDLKERVEAQAGVVENLDAQLKLGEKLWNDYNNSVTTQAVKTAEQLKAIQENIFESGKADIEARIALAKAGTQEELKAQIDLAQIERDNQTTKLRQEIESINEVRRIRQENNQDIGQEELSTENIRLQTLQSQILKIESETVKKIKTIKTDAAIQLLNEQKQLEENRLIEIQKGSQEELDLRLRIIDISADAEVKQLDKTAGDIKNIRARQEAEKNELIKAFAEKAFEEELAIEKNFLLKRLAVVTEGSNEELELQKDLINNQVKSDIEHAELTIANEELLYAEIVRIQTEGHKKQDDLDKAHKKTEIERSRDHANALIDLENLKLAARRDDPGTSDLKRIELSRKILENEKEIIENREAALEEELRNGTITKQQFADAIIQIDNDLAKNQIELAKNSAEQQAALINDLVGLYSQAFSNMFPNASEEFQKLGNDFGNLVKKFQDGEITMQEGLQSAGDILASVGSLIQEGIQAQIDALNEQHEAVMQEITDIESLISAKEDQISEEEELNKRGLANNLNLKKKELAELLKQKEEALKKDKEIKDKQIELQKKQIAYDSITQASQLLLAAAQILASFASLPFGIGVAIAAGVIAGMYAIFSSAKAKSDALTTTLETGGDIKIKEGRDYGKITGRRHTQGGHRIEGTNLEVEDGEFLSHRYATEKYYKFLTSANKEDFQTVTLQDILNLPGISFPELKEFKAIKSIELNQKAISEITDNKTILKTIEIRNAYTFSNTGVEQRLDTLNQRMENFEKKYFDQPETHILPEGDYRIMKIEGNTTTVVKPYKND